MECARLEDTSGLHGSDDLFYPLWLCHWCCAARHAAFQCSGNTMLCLKYNLRSLLCQTHQLSRPFITLCLWMKPCSLSNCSFSNMMLNCCKARQFYAVPGLKCLFIILSGQVFQSMSSFSAPSNYTCLSYPNKETTFLRAFPFLEMNYDLPGNK